MIVATTTTATRENDWHDHCYCCAYCLQHAVWSIAFGTALVRLMFCESYSAVCQNSSMSTWKRMGWILVGLLIAAPGIGLLST